jgi:hypothetical protein
MEQADNNKYKLLKEGGTVECTLQAGREDLGSSG